MDAWTSIATVTGAEAVPPGPKAPGPLDRDLPEDADEEHLVAVRTDELPVLESATSSATGRTLLRPCLNSGMLHPWEVQHRSSQPWIAPGIA
jgi:hypothetical protein